MGISAYDQCFDNVRTISGICETVATSTGLTEEERTVGVGTGETIYRNRAEQSHTRLSKAEDDHPRKETKVQNLRTRDRGSGESAEHSTEEV